MKRALPLVLLGAALLLVCVGVAALGANFFLKQNDSVDLSQWKSPSAQVDSKKIVLATGLEPLAGISDGVAIDDALQQGDWESAFATAAFSPDLNDADRAGVMLLLGSRYAAGKQPARAAWAYQYAAILALISPLPSDLVRAQTLIQAAQGLAGLNLSTAARRSVDQAFLITQYSPAIPGDARSRLYAEIVQTYSQLGLGQLAASAQRASQQSDPAAGGDISGTVQAPYRLTGAELKLTDALNAKMQARVTAAKELIDQVALHPPKTDKDLPGKQVQALGDRLYEEDGARSDYYDALDKAATKPADQAMALRGRITWLALKLRVAQRGFGVSLVSEWETGAKDIAQALSDAQDQLYKLNEQQATAAAKSDVADRQLEEVLRAELVAGRWGLYQSDENDLRSRLDEVAGKLRDDQVNALRLDMFTSNKDLVFILVPDDLYGQGEKALPK
ncbi:MAG: hypothetical protein WCF84_25650 [Anaerolineae bacterium]